MRPVFGGWFALNGNGEMTGTTWLEESGQLEGPVMLTNTHSVGTVHQATIAWRIRQGEPDASGYCWALPVVAETWDGHLNDINGFHVKPEHVDAALDGAASGPVAEGNVGGGTGMVCYEFKGGIGTASRVVDVLGSSYTVGVLVQANYGLREQLRIAGVPVGNTCASTGSTRSPTRTSTAPVRSSSSSPPTRRCCRTSSNASPGARLWASVATARSRATDRVTSSSPSRRPTTHWVVPTSCWSTVDSQ